MIDIHHHIVYGIDDGPKDIETTQQMLKVLVEEGVHTVVATPHIAPGIEHFPMDVYYKRLLEVQQLGQEMGLDLRILAGAEIRYTHQTANYLAEGSIPTLGGSDKLLIEFTGKDRFETIRDAVQTVQRSGITPVLAHINRYPRLILPVRRAQELKEEFDVCYQINSECIVNSLNYRINRSIRKLLDDGLIDFVATDSHDLAKRRCNMKATYEKLVSMVGREYADKLTGRNATAEAFLGSVDEEAISLCVRVFRQKSQLRARERNMR